ncbi:MAG: hypothetical protein ACTJLL_02660, partial [Anaplasma sp.]
MDRIGSKPQDQIALQDLVSDNSTDDLRNDGETAMESEFDVPQQSPRCWRPVALTAYALVTLVALTCYAAACYWATIALVVPVEIAASIILSTAAVSVFLFAVYQCARPSALPGHKMHTNPQSPQEDTAQIPQQAEEALQHSQEEVLEEAAQVEPSATDNTPPKSQSHSEEIQNPDIKVVPTPTPPTPPLPKLPQTESSPAYPKNMPTEAVTEVASTSTLPKLSQTEGLIARSAPAPAKAPTESHVDESSRQIPTLTTTQPLLTPIVTTTHDNTHTQSPAAAVMTSKSSPHMAELTPQPKVQLHTPDTITPINGTQQESASNNAIRSNDAQHSCATPLSDAKSDDNSPHLSTNTDTTSLVEEVSPELSTQSYTIAQGESLPISGSAPSHTRMQQDLVVTRAAKNKKKGGINLKSKMRMLRMLVPGIFLRNHITSPDTGKPRQHPPSEQTETYIIATLQEAANLCAAPKMQAITNTIEEHITDDTSNAEVVVCEAAQVYSDHDACDESHEKDDAMIKVAQAVTGNHPDASEHLDYVTHKEDVAQARGDYPKDEVSENDNAEEQVAVRQLKQHDTADNSPDGAGNGLVKESHKESGAPLQKQDGLTKDEVLTNSASNGPAAKPPEKSSTAAVHSLKSNASANNGASNEPIVRSRVARSAPPRPPAPKNVIRPNDRVIERPPVAVCSRLERSNRPLGNVVNDPARPLTKAPPRPPAAAADHLKSNVSQVKLAAKPFTIPSNHPEGDEHPQGNTAGNDSVKPKNLAAAGASGTPIRPNRSRTTPPAGPSSVVGSRFGATKIAPPEPKHAKHPAFTKKVSSKIPTMNPAMKPKFVIQTVTSKAKHCKKKVTKGMHSAIKAIDKALGTDIPTSSRKYKFTRISDFNIHQTHTAYLLITTEDWREETKLQNILKNVKQQQVWICDNSLHTERGSISVANLKFEILHTHHRRDDNTLKHVSGYQMAMELSFHSSAEIAVTWYKKLVSVCHSGRSAEIVLEFGINRNCRVDILQLAATSVAFQDYKMSFFYIYTEIMLRSMLQYVRGIVYGRRPMANGEAIPMHTILSQYTKDFPDDMANIISDFLTVHQLGQALYFDVAHNFDSIDALVRYGIASDDSYPSQHARFWELVLREVWGQDNCKIDTLPKNFSSIVGQNDSVASLHLICALLCKKQNITNREKLINFICTLMASYDG